MDRNDTDAPKDEKPLSRRKAQALRMANRPVDAPKLRGPDAPGTCRRYFDSERKRRYVEILAETGEPAAARREVGVSISTIDNHRKSDLGFKEAEEEAMSFYRASLGKEIHRRGFVGVEEPVFFMGQECGRIRKYSDSLAALHAKRHVPEYRDRSTVDQNVNDSRSAPPVDFATLTPESRELLRRIVEIEAKAKAKEVANENPVSEDGGAKLEP